MHLCEGPCSPPSYVVSNSWWWNYQPLVLYPRLKCLMDLVELVLVSRIDSAWVWYQRWKELAMNDVILLTINHSS